MNQGPLPPGRGRNPLVALLSSIIGISLIVVLFYLTFQVFIWVILPLIGLVIGYLLGLRHGMRLGRRYYGGGPVRGHGPGPRPQGWHKPGEGGR